MQPDETQTEATNPYLEVLPGPAKTAFIQRRGTEQEKKWLAEAVLHHLTDEDRERLQAKADYARRVAGIDQAPVDPVDRYAKTLSAARKRLRNRMLSHRGGGRGGDAVADPAALYYASRSLLWDAYATQVEYETGQQPTADSIDGSLSRAMNQVAHWLVGLEEWQGGKVEGQCISPIKSIYIVGDTGNGKSTLATAAYQASIDLSSIDGSDMRLGLTSMDQLHLAIQSSQSLERIDEVCRGHMVLDELRLKHLEHLHYGNAVSLVADILINRHHIWKQHGQQTIITTNVPPDELLSALDDSRITGRLLQQYHILPVTGSSYRTAN